MDKDFTSEIIKTAADRFGILMVKPYQLLVMQRILEQDSGLYEKTDQIVILPTGTGKSLCFLLPATLCNGITVIVYPLIALMNDQKRKLDYLGIEAVCLKGGQSSEERNEVFNKLKNGAKILITNPETLEQENLIRRLKKLPISLFVCDEAHCISQWGKEFRPSYLNLGKILKRINPQQILAFTATASENTISDIKNCLFAKEPLVVQGDGDRENIIYSALPVHDRSFGVIQLLQTCKKPCIVFCSRRELTFKLCLTCLRVFKETPMRYYHAGLSKKERETIEKWFLDSQDGVLFATSAYGMGIDKPNIRTVIHYELPSSIEEYLQESGRAGRDGKTSFSWVLKTDEDIDSDNRLKKIFSSDECRRHALLLELGQDKEECSGCDVCLGTTIDKPIEDSIIINAVKKSPFKYTVPLLRSILCKNPSLSFVQRQKRIDPNYGLLDGFPEQIIENSIYLLISHGLLKEFKLRKSPPRLYYAKKKNLKKRFLIKQRND